MKQRLDVAMTELGLAPSRERAQSLIMAGVVRVNNIKVDKAGKQVSESDTITVIEDAIPFVSRGGLKLQKAMDSFGLSLEGKRCADIGASTGGFTDCMLKHGAAEVFAIDVGYGQLDWSLRTNERVKVMERTNARFMEPSWFGLPLDFASIDVSFISLRLILPPLYDCLLEGGKVVALIKPQFEAGKAEVKKGSGVILSEQIHERVCTEIMEFASGLNFTVEGLAFSPITGPKGNIEFLILLQKGGCENVTDPGDFRMISQNVVKNAHRELK